jgi:hypothetical protein
LTDREGTTQKIFEKVEVLSQTDWTFSKTSISELNFNKIKKHQFRGFLNFDFFVPKAKKE